MTQRPAIFLNGTVGVGKTTVVDHLGDLLEEARNPFSLVDLDALRRTWPAPAGDPFQHELELTNLASLRRNDPEPTGRTVVLAGVIEERAARGRYERALGSPVVVVRLVARPEVLRARIEGRHADPAQRRHLEWHLSRAPELAAVLERADLDDHVLDVSDLAPPAVARAVLRLASTRPRTG